MTLSKLQMRTIFKNRFGHFRAGWRILFYFAFIIAFFELSEFLENSFLLLKGESLGNYALLQNRFVTKLLKLLSVVIPSLVLLKWLDKRPLGLLGVGFYKGFLRELGIGMLMGLILVSGSIFILWATGLASFTFNGFSLDILLYLLLCLLILIISASYEEILFRGYIFQSLLEGSNLWITLGIYALLFGAAHLDNGIGTVTFAVVAGVYLGLLYYKTRALWMCIGMHFVWNWIEAPIFGIGVEGSKFLRKSLFSYQPFESSLFGNADLVITLLQALFMIVFTILIWKVAWLKPSEYNQKLWAHYPPKFGTEAKIDDAPTTISKSGE